MAACFRGGVFFSLERLSSYWDLGREVFAHGEKKRIEQSLP